MCISILAFVNNTAVDMAVQIFPWDSDSILLQIYTLSPTNWHLPSTSTKIRLWAVVAANLHWKELGVKIRNEALCALEKLAEQVLR